MRGAVGVRRARADDLAAIVEIEEATFSEAWSPETFASLLGRDEMVVLVATEEEVVIGYGVVAVGSGEAELANLAVGAGWRGRGVGEALVERALDELGEREIGRAYLAVRESNTRAAELYRRFGFREIGRHPSYYGRPAEDALIMALELAPRRRPAADPGDRRGAASSS